MLAIRNVKSQASAVAAAGVAVIDEDGEVSELDSDRLGGQTICVLGESVQVYPADLGWRDDRTVDRARRFPIVGLERDRVDACGSITDVADGHACRAQW